MKKCTKNIHADLPIPCGRFGECGNVVCRNCSFVIDGLDYCESCQQDIHNEAYEDGGICPNCDGELEPIYEERHPDGIGIKEIVGYKPCKECQNDNNT